ncbi:hypothetical protein VDG1235_3641 [Verrucomicrobiia bacterium DG1235]|nr:hypothetical protein VDG1235_3641 [Verrucomicrobiae bacterium DG1235]
MNRKSIQGMTSGLVGWGEKLWGTLAVAFGIRELSRCERFVV